MAFSPSQAPVYGGSTIVLAFSDDISFPPDARLYLAFEGSTQRHVTLARCVNEQTLHSIIPEHNNAEWVQLTIFMCHHGNCLALATSRFYYHHDCFYRLAEFLILNATNQESLKKCTSLISSSSVEHTQDASGVDASAELGFTLLPDSFPVLDDKLYKAIQHVPFDDSWSCLPSFDSGSTPTPQCNLFHLLARFGLEKVATFFMNKPQADIASTLPDDCGNLPRDVALQHGYPDLADVLGAAGITPQQEQDNGSKKYSCAEGVIHEHENGTVSLTTIPEKHKHTVEQDINLLHEFNQSLKCDPSLKSDLSLQTDPSSQSDHPVHSDLQIDDMDILVPLEAHEMTDTAASPPRPSPSHDKSRSMSEDFGIPSRLKHPRLDFCDDTYVDTTVLSQTPRDSNLSDDIIDSSQLPLQASLLLCRSVADQSNVFLHNSTPVTERLPTKQIPAESAPNWKALNSHNVLEDNLTVIRGINSELQKLQEINTVGLLNVQALRREHLERFSSSCPALDAVDNQSPLSPVIEEDDLHKSMLDLTPEDFVQDEYISCYRVEDCLKGVDLPQVPDETFSVLYSVASENSALRSDSLLQSIPSTSSEPSIESDIRIFINDVTVDSSQDTGVFLDNTEDDDDAFNQGTSDSPIAEAKHQQHQNSSSLGSHHYKFDQRRSSWCGDDMHHLAGEQRKQFKATMLAITGKSMSLSSLDDSDEDDDDDDDICQSRAKSSNVSLNSGTGSRSHSPITSAQTSPTHEGLTKSPSGSICIRVPQTNVRKSWSANKAQSTSPVKTAKKPNVAELSGGAMRSSSQGDSTDMSRTPSGSYNLAIPFSSVMQKSLSSPSLPDVGEHCQKDTANTSSTGSLEKRRDSKHEASSSYLMIQKLVTAHDAQFQRQEGVEEEDENLNQLLKTEGISKSRISLIEFLNDNFENAERPKNEKRRRSSVFSKLTRGSYRVRKSKEKENKSRSTHQFVSVSFSNSTACDVCCKSLANKAALSCEGCMVNVHENSCKDQIAPCAKFKQQQQQAAQLLQQRVPAKELTNQTTGGITGTREKGAISGVSVLKHVPSFKEKRSISTPIRPFSMTSSGLGLQRSSTSPGSISSTAPGMTPASPPAVYNSGYLHWRRVATMLGIDKVISEEGEAGNNMARGHEMASSTSNIADAISVSMESLEGESSTDVTDIGDDPVLMCMGSEAEAWSVTVDKKTLKKMSAKDIKRQDTIWELVQTELHHCRALKILQKVYSQRIQYELHCTGEILHKLFPRLSDLIDQHTSFLMSLQALQALKVDRSIDEIGATLVAQFSGDSGDRMKSAYGAFCSQHKCAVQMYKDLLKSDRKFQSLIKICNSHPLSQKREIPAFMLLISQRISKYPILIESILKGTKDKKDRENLSQALQLSRELLQDVDAQVDACQKEERLLDIYNKLDSRGGALFKGQKFKKSDLLANDRKLIHDGVVGWKNARGKVIDVIAVILSDVVIFVQENNQKYTFFSQDNKSCIVSLCKLLVREKSDTRDNRGVYLICPNKQEPEMYELVCRTTDERKSWISIMRAAVEKCPEEDDGNPSEVDEQKKLQEARSHKLQEIIELLHKKDQQMKACCDEKNKLLMEFLETYTREDPSTLIRVHDDHEDAEQPPEVGDVLQAAIMEASRLTVMLQSGGESSTNLGRSVSSVGEHVSSSYTIPPVPKRAETFAGFDSQEKEMPKALLKKRPTYVVIPPVMDADDRGHSPINTSTELEPEPKEKIVRKMSSSLLQTIKGLNDREEMDSKASDRSSDRGSLGELSVTSAASLVPALPPRDQIVSIAQLSQYVHTIVHLTAQQGTAVESLRAQLAHANERINKLSAEMQDRKTSNLRHNQLEELRNLQESISRERQDWEKEREQERAALERERIVLHEHRKKLEKEQHDLKQHKEELRRQRDIFQRQIDLLRQDGILTSEPQLQMSKMTDTAAPIWSVSSSSLGTQRSNTPPLTAHNSASQLSYLEAPSSSKTSQIIHKRSASAEISPTVTDDIVKGNVAGGHIANISARSESSPHIKEMKKPFHRYSMTSLSGVTLPGGQAKLPVHLLSCTNEQKVGVTNKQQQSSGVQQVLPFKLANLAGSAGGVGVSSGPPHISTVHTSGSLGLYSASGSSGVEAVSSSASNSSAKTVPSQTNIPPSQRHLISSNSFSGRTSTGTLAPQLSLVNVMKLAEPGAGRSRAASQPNVAGPTPPPRHKLSQKSQTQPQLKAEPGVIYF